MRLSLPSTNDAGETLRDGNPFVWPRWLPVRARLPLIAQITGAVALTALLVGPWWSRFPESPAAVDSQRRPRT